jgi:SAM-dependent methyltransferase
MIMRSTKDQAKKWDSLARNYEELVFNVFESDSNLLLIKSIRRLGSNKKIAGDFGCGVGRALPLLSKHFKKVYAMDFSPMCVKEAVRLNLGNVICETKDLSNSHIQLPAVDFGLCVNVAISNDVKKNHAILNNVCKALKRNGTAIFVIPSWESASMVTWRTMELYNKDGFSVSEIPEEHLGFYTGKNIDVSMGVFDVDGSPTKHWLITELMQIFEKPGLHIEAINKIEYDWKTELVRPPSWLGYPYPWDWMVKLRKVKHE